MEDCVSEEMVEYSFNSLERVFSTIGELAPVGNNCLGMEQHLGQQVEGLVPSHSDTRVLHPRGGDQLLPVGNQDPSFFGLLPSIGNTMVDGL